ncbi:MAG: hypothetical protein LC650_02230 [Actinobacteria bacterium]|nr:hypothetical protein [Actinomycetota bacterium]
MKTVEPFEYVTHVRAFGTDDCQLMQKWLSKNIGARDWDWVYSVNIWSDSEVVEIVEFANPRHQTLFEIAWSEVCVNTERT